MPISMAVKTLDYTPTAPPYPSLWMGGYAGSPRGNQGQVDRRLRAQCVVFDDGAGVKVLLRVDVVSIPAYVHQAIRSQVLSLVGNNTANFMMIASHTHSGPMIGTTRPEPYIMMGLTPADINAIEGTTTVFVNQLVQLVQQTVALGRTPVTLWYKTGTTTIGYNRAEAGTVLSTVSALLARKSSDNSPFAVLFGYACHPVSRGNDRVFCSDYPGAATDTITSALGVPALFFQGTAGDQEPNDPHQPSQVTTLGAQLGNKVVNMVNTTGWTAVTGPFSTGFTEVKLPLMVDLGDPAAVIQTRDKYSARLDTYPPDDTAYRHAAVMVQQLQGVGVPRWMNMPIQRWHMGGLTVLALGHEVLSRYEVALKAAFAGNLWVMAYANECEGYVAGNDTLKAGETKHFGYEAGWTDDNTMSGPGTWTSFYAYACPLAYSAAGAVAGTTEKTLLDAATALLNS
ncbi:hypothetical protein Lesp02_77030 [Lentzea sp. NBRC 105346]|uniref:hypothetical protein n=1 Tax=Lentzea sp. NBRC 105346 TaxID=3032205 RepID=UPI0024A4BBAC|nr:hypothetical protein [Lentzea sp. NBRC 105346]GLZ35516.1 hypothetical protein Lesp02_77030 [Lentzea sp. NBRC 105346]